EDGIRDKLVTGVQTCALPIYSPYLPPKPYDDLGPVQRMQAGREARRYLTLRGIVRACAGPFDVPAGALARMRHLYDRSINLLDRSEERRVGKERTRWLSTRR